MLQLGQDPAYAATAPSRPVSACSRCHLLTTNLPPCLPAVLLCHVPAGDLAGALLWSAAMWYASPLQLLLVFLGKIETERPSDWLMYNIGRAAQLP